MTKQEEEELFQIAEIAYKAFVLTLETASLREKMFVCENRDMFIGIFNRIVLVTKRLLEEEKK